MDSKVVRADFGSGLICPRALTFCALKSSAPFGARQDNCADLLGLQTRRGSNHSAAQVSESNSRSNVVQIRREFACVSSRWKVLSGEFRRRPTGLAIKFRKSDRVGRRGLSEPREDYSRLPTDAFPWLDSVAESIVDSVESSIQLWWLIQSIQDFSRGFSNHCVFIFISSNTPHNSSNWIIARSLQYFQRTPHRIAPNMLRKNSVERTRSKCCAPSLLVPPKNRTQRKRCISPVIFWMSSLSK
jgi:hypothetical protein